MCMQLQFISQVFVKSGVTATFSIEEWRLSTFIACTASSHRDNHYHNLQTTCYGLQATYIAIHATRAYGVLPQTAQLALLIAALCRDLDHDGELQLPHIHASKFCWLRESIMILLV